jgi:hypothetical protein
MRDSRSREGKRKPKTKPETRKTKHLKLEERKTFSARRCRSSLCCDFSKKRKKRGKKAKDCDFPIENT